MPSQKLRLEAEMKDNASPAVKQLRAELSALQAASADTRGVTKLNAELAKLQSEAAANASPAVRKLRAELTELQKGTAAQQAVASLNREIAALKKNSGDLAPTAGMKAFGGWMGEAKTAATGVMGAIGGVAEVLGPIGIGALGAGAAVSALASEMKRLGEQSLAMKELSRETGISLDFVNRWSHAGEHFAVSGDSMRGMLDRFASQIPDFNRGVGSMFKEFSIWPDVVRKMRSESPADALMDALAQVEEVGRVRGPEVQKQVLEAMGLGSEAEKLFSERLSGFRKQLEKPWAMPFQDLTKQALALRDAGIALNNDFERLENDIAPGFIRALTVGVDAIDLIVKGWAWEFKTIAGLFRASPNALVLPQADENAAKVNPSLPKAIPHYGAPGTPYDDAMPGLGAMGARKEKMSYGSGGPNSLLHNASFTTDGGASPNSQFGVRGLVADGSKEGVLAALREWSLQNDARGGLGGGGNGSGGDGFGTDGGGGGHAGGRQGFSSRMGAPSGEGGRPFRGSPGVGGWWTSDHVQHAVDRLVKEGHLSQAGAEGLVSRWASVEAPGGPTAVNPASGAWGIGQWLGSRGGGRTADFDGQISKAIGELNGPESRAAQALRSAKNAREGAVGATMFERAEHYNGRTGVDDWTSKSEAGAARIHDLANGKGAGAGDGSAASAVDKGMALLGRSGGEVGKAFGVHITPGEWCAEFVNGALKASGIKGTNSAMAGSFSKWGHAVAAAGVKKGDVVVDGDPAGHVSLATGATRMKNGRLQMETLNGNWGHSHGQSAVKKDWLTAEDWVHVRRADGLPNPQVANRSADHPLAGRRADRDLGGAGHASREGDSNHMLTIDLRDPSGHVKSTRIERNGPLKVDMPNRWQTGRNPLIGA